LPTDLLADSTLRTPPPVAAAPEPFPARPYQRDELLHELFRASARRAPNAIAVRLAEPDPETTRRSILTYEELRCRASRFARHLRSKGVGRGDRVVICLPRGLDQYMAVLGVLEAGAAYAPVDWSIPQDRVDYIVEECSARAVITATDRAEAFAGSNAVVVDVLADLGDIAALDPSPLSRAETGAQPGDIAYLIYTSGSTGRPKGVMITHANAAYQVRAEASILGVEPSDRVFAGASLAFDISVEEMWAAFFTGAELLVSSESLIKAGPDLALALDAHGVTVWSLVPSLLAVIEHPMPKVRLLITGGEAIPGELARRWMRPGRRLLNTYGPTETTVACTWCELLPGRPVTIGTPIPGFTAWVVDEAMQPVAPGAEGELVIGGPGVGAGYLNRPELTAEKFALTPFGVRGGGPERVYRTGDLVRVNADGDIEFLGRIDTQVKIRGYRVELGEIEAVLAEDASVAQAVVQLFPEEDGSDVMVAFLTPRTAGAEVDLDSVRAQAELKLPAYMRPMAYEVRAALPTLISGKVNRKVLEKPRRMTIERREIEPPKTPLETKLVAVWNQVFAPQPVGATDDFFEDLGGHSLRAARMVSIARTDPVLVSVSIQDLYAAPTVRKLAERLKNAAPTTRVEEPFHPIPQLRRTLCTIAQALALIPIFAFAGVQWIFPYLAYAALATPDPRSRIPALLVAGAAFVVLPPLMVLLSVAVKWIVIGRYKPGDYPLWGVYYFRWWLVRRFLAVIPTQFLAGTPLMALYYRLLGAKIGRDVFLAMDQIDAPDLVSIGDGAIISDGALFATTSVERGLLRIGRNDVGERAFVGTMAVIGRNASLGNDAVLEDLSAIPGGEHVPDNEVWTGSPAIKRGMAEPRPPVERPSRLRRILVTLALMVTAPLLPLAAVLPIAPGLLGLIEVDWATRGYSYVLLSPVLALIYVVLMCALMVMAKWLLLGRVKPGVYSIWSNFYVRYWFVKQLSELALDLLHPIYATLYVRPWYLALGAKVGQRAEISTATSVVPDLIDIGAESFIADGVVFGAARAEPGAIRLEKTRIGRRSFIGNSGLLPTGADIGDEVLIGVLSKPPEDGARAMETGTTWFGSPAIKLPHRQVMTVFDEGARFRPSKRLVATRLAIEFVRIILSLTVFVAMFSAVLTIVGDLSDLPNGALWIALSFPFLYLGFALGAGLFVLILKWAVMGRYKPTNAPLWSPFVWRTELVTSTYENLAVPLLLDALRGTPFLNIYLRLLGCKIGKRVFTDTTDITEYDLVRIGDDAALNENAGIQTHLFEDRIMKVSGIYIGARTTVGSLAIALYDSVIEDDAQLGDLSVLMKGETLPAGTAWEGSPAQPARSV
jgi:non-ribosomal peptide synthetase-like protein